MWKLKLSEEGGFYCREVFRAESRVIHSPCLSCWLPAIIREGRWHGKLGMTNAAIWKYLQASPSVSLGNNCCGSLELFGEKIHLNGHEREEKWYSQSYLSIQVRAIGLCRQWIPESNKEMMGRESTGEGGIIKNLTKGLGDRNLVLWRKHWRRKEQAQRKPLSNP